MRAAVELARALAAVTLDRAKLTVSFSRSIATAVVDRAKGSVIYDRAIISAVVLGQFIDQLKNILTDSATASDSGSGRMIDYAETPFEYFAEDYVGEKFTF